MGPRELRDKYERMYALREANARAKTDPRSPEPDTRAELARLAEEFPGALREIDQLPLGTIRERIVALSALEKLPGTPAPWMIAQVAFHRHARGALAAKRWLAGRKDVTPAMHADFARAHAGHDAALFASDLRSVARPPRGRIVDLVFEHVARALDVTPTEARALVLGAAAKR